MTFFIFITARAAVRELTLTPTSEVIPLVGSGSFDSEAIGITALSGLVDCNAPSISVGQQTLAGTAGVKTATTASTLVAGPGGFVTLTIPVSTSFDLAVLSGATAPDSRLTLTGQLVSVGVPAIPEPEVVGLMVLGASVVLGRRRGEVGEL